jgi:hypothetical protein
MEPESAAMRGGQYRMPTGTRAPPPPAPPSESARALAHYTNASVPADKRHRCGACAISGWGPPMTRQHVSQCLNPEETRLPAAARPLSNCPARGTGHRTPFNSKFIISDFPAGRFFQTKASPRQRICPTEIHIRA